MRFSRTHIRRASLLVLPLLAMGAFAQTPDPQHLRDQYLNKPLVVRGFYSGDRLHYDSSGSLTGEARAGDWTTDGFVQLNDISVTERHLTARGVRLIVISYDNVFQFFSHHKLGRNGTPLNVQIEVELSPDGALAESADAALSKVFLTAQDRFRDLVPDYWKYCVQDALSDSDEHCHFAKEFMAIPSFALGDRYGLWDGLPRNPPSMLSRPFTPPRPSSLDRGCLTDSARQAKYRGVVDFQVVIDSNGQPSKARIFSPIGFGLDARAAHALETSKWKPAEIDGKPITMVLTMQMDCTK